MRLFMWVLETKWLRRTLGTAAALFIMRIGVIDDAFSERALFYLGVAAFFFMMAILFVVVSFLVYHGFRHGNFLMEYDADPIVVKKVEQYVKREKKWCPICRANSGCRVRKHSITGMVVHVLR
jgi:hypothetical protein